MNLVRVGEYLAVGVLGGLGSWFAGRPRPVPVVVVMSHAGRDQAVTTLLQGARNNVHLRTEGLNLVPAVDELAQAIQRKVAVTVEMPLDVGLSVEGSRLPRMLMSLGAVVSFRSDPAGNYRGTYLEIDGKRFLYSASPLTLNLPGALVSYVVGPIQ
jgi:hypothetical protein